MSFHRFRSPSGQERPWRVVEMIQGKPLRHPTHPMFVHFPVAFYLGTIVFDVMSRIDPTEGLVRAGTYMLVGGVLGTIPAAFTGLVDWWFMSAGTPKRRLANRHMLLQIVAAGFFLVNLALRWGKRNVLEADVAWIVLGVAGYLVLIVGQWLGGLLVYERGMRVSTARAREEATG